MPNQGDDMSSIDTQSLAEILEIMKKQIIDIQFILDDDINIKILSIVESNSQDGNKKDMLMKRVNLLENELRQIKERLNKIA